MSGELRVLHVYKDVHPEVPGGIERHVDMLRRAVPGVRSSVLICSRSRTTRIRTVGSSLEVAVGELGRALSAPLAPTFPLWLRRIPADVIHLHMPNPTGEVAAVLDRRGLPLVVSYHADIVRQAKLLPLYAPLVRACLQRAAAVVCGTRGILRTSPLLPGFEDRITTIPYAVDTAFFSPAAADGAAVAAIRARLGAPLVVATGRLVYYKGFERLIDLAGSLGGSLAIVGGGPLEESLRQRAQGHPNVTVVGGVSDRELRDYLAAADCFVLGSTSRAESFGIATVEAQSMGVPAVVTDVGTGTGEAVRDGVTGTVVGMDDLRGLTLAINRVLGDPALGRQMGEAARNWAVERFDHDAVARAHADLYMQVAAVSSR